MAARSVCSQHSPHCVRDKHKFGSLRGPHQEHLRRLSDSLCDSDLSKASRCLIPQTYGLGRRARVLDDTFGSSHRYPMIAEWSEKSVFRPTCPTDVARWLPPRWRAKPTKLKNQWEPEVAGDRKSPWIVLCLGAPLQFKRSGSAERA